MAYANTPAVTPTTELEAVNILLSAIGEAPVNNLGEVTADVSVARNVLAEISKEVQLEGWHWNTEDNYPLRPDANSGKIGVHPSLVEVHFKEPQDLDLVVRGAHVYDRTRHSFIFPQGTLLLCTVVLLLDFGELPEAARRYITLRSMRVFQERVVGSSTLSDFHAKDEARARAIMAGAERRLNRPNLLTGHLAPRRNWRPYDVLTGRR